MTVVSVAVLVLLLGGVGGAMYGCPMYSVYEQRLTGEAELARAQQNRQIAVNEAQAKMDAAKLLAEAEVERAKGVAAANKIIAEGLGGPEGYLRYLWIQSLDNQQNKVIYVPTEANLPVLEAVRHTLSPQP
jgi:regulator of protease activity HflC (stomatin/prohibitin superfamily)